MKTLISAIVVVVAATVPLSTMAKSTIDKSKLTVASKNKYVLNAAVGDGATANTGSLTVKNATISKSKVTVATKNSLVLNAAIGKKATANTGSINIR